MIQIADLVGKPFKIGGRGPKEYDCYGLVMEIYKRIGIQLPDYDSPDEGSLIAAMMSKEVELWEPCHQQEGATALLRIPGSTHVGVILQHDKFIHAWENGGVMIERLSRWQPRLIGIYRYVGHRHN